jgi:hypothetical protein
LDIDKWCRAQIRESAYHFILVLNKEFDTLNGRGTGFGDGLTTKNDEIGEQIG